MNPFRQRLYAAGLMLAGFGSIAGISQNLTPGQTQTGTISAAAQINTYTFNVNAGDVFDFTLVTTEGGLDPEIQIYNSSLSKIASAAPAYCNGSTIELNTVKFTEPGTYSVWVSDCSATNKGSYALYSQRINNPAGASSLSFGETASGSIVSPAQSVTYTLTGNAGDTVDLTMTATSGGLNPKIRLYSQSTGVLVSQVNPAYCNGSTIEMNPAILPSSGTYTVLVGDCSDVNTGTYDLYAQRVDNPGPPVVPLGFGQTQTGTIGEPSQSNTYSFAAKLDDVIDFTMTTTKGGLNPKLRLYSETTGALVAGAEPAYCNGSTIEMNTVKIPATGKYSLLVGDCSDTNTGSYNLYSQRINNPSGALPLAFDQTKAGSITAAAQSVTYTFSGNAKDMVDLTMTATSGGLNPKIRLYSQTTGALVGQVNPAYCNGSTIEMNPAALPASGLYTVLVGDCSDTNTGNFDLYGQRLNQPSGAVPVFWGDTQSGKISSPAQSNTYAFVGFAGNAVDFHMTTTSGGLNPKIRLYNPDGSADGSASPAYCNGSTTQLGPVTLKQNGTYTVLVGDCSDTLTGSYSFSSECSGNCPITPLITWPTPAPIPYGTPLSATQLDAVASIPDVTLTGAYAYSPAAGTVLKAGSQKLTVTYTPADTSKYTVATDSVFLTVNKATPACTWATPAAIVYGTPLSAAQLDADCPIPGTFVYSPAAGTVLTATTHTLTVIFTPADTADYLPFTGSVQLVVAPAATKITWPTPAPIIYGTPLSTAQLDATASVAGTFAYMPMAGTVLPVGMQTLSVSFAPADPLDYTPGNATVKLIVNKAVLTVTANSLSRPYGAANPPLTALLSGFVNGDTQATATTGAPSCTTTATAASIPGAYPITCTAGTLTAASYSFTFVNGTLTVTKAKPAITWPTPAAIPYGTALSAAQLDATSAVPGTFVYSPAIGTVLKAGAHTLSATLTPTDATDYTTSTRSVKLTVTQVTPAISWPAPTAITYGTPLSAAQLDASSPIAGSFKYTPAAGAVIAAGSQSLSAAFTPTDATDYTDAADTVPLTVNKAMLTVTAPSLSRSYGAANPALPAVLTGFVNGDTQGTATTGAPNCTTTATAASKVGVYPIICTVGTLSASNYTFKFVGGSLTVTQAKPSITWPTPAPIVYGTPLSATQLDATTKVAGSFVYSPAASKVLAAGTHSLSATFTPDDATDYTIATASVQLTVNKATPVITWPTPAAIPSGTALSATQLDATANVPGTFDYTPSAGTVPPAGSDTLSTMFTPTDSVDYTTATATVVLVVKSPAPIVTLSATKVTFGSQPVNSGSPRQTVTLKNTGNAALNISSLELTGADVLSFNLSENCGSSVAAGASCSIVLSFYPTTSGAATAAVTIKDNAAGSPQTIALSGTGQTGQAGQTGQ
jgi:hypothetical protein